MMQSDSAFFRNSDCRTSVNDRTLRQIQVWGVSERTSICFIFCPKSYGNINGKKVHLNQIKRRSCFFYRGSTYSPNE